ncbi:MAG: hypothetical protein JO199_02040 [Candidatus Eremiobacteraeota bacterium]|nr:hypothetical protein [Candidatus Eremiobacteraeota bacterium]
MAISLGACVDQSHGLTPSGSQLQPVATRSQAYGTSPGIAVYVLDDGKTSHSVATNDLRVGADGGLYYSVSANVIESPAPTSGVVGRFDFTTKKQIYAIVPYVPGFVEQTSSAIWVGEADNSKGTVAVERYASIGGTSTTVAIPIGPFTGTLTGLNGGVAAGSDGRVWFGSNNSPQLVAIDQATNTVATYTLVSHKGGATPIPQYMAVGPDKSLWVTDVANDGVFRVAATGQATFAALPQGPPYAQPPYHLLQGITVGSDSKLYTATLGESAPYYDPARGSLNAGSAAAAPNFASIAVPTHSAPYQLASANGKVYYSDLAFAVQGLGVYNIATKKVVVLPLNPSASGGIAVDSSGIPWLSCNMPTTSAACIERVALTSTWQLYPSTNFQLFSVTPGIIGIGETGNSGPFTTSSSSLCKVTPIPGFDHNFKIEATKQETGKCAVDVKDAHGRIVRASVTVQVPV